MRASRRASAETFDAIFAVLRQRPVASYDELVKQIRCERARLRNTLAWAVLTGLILRIRWRPALWALPPIAHRRPK